MSEQNRSTGVFRRDARAPYLTLSMDNPVVRVALAVGVLGGSVALLVPGMHRGDPDLGYDAVGSIATRDILIPSDYTHSVVDQRATQEKRELTAKAVRPVYDYRLEIKEGKLGHIQAAFALGRETVGPIAEKIAQLGEGSGGQGGRGDERKRALARENPKSPEIREVWKSIKRRQVEVLDGTVRQIAIDWQVSDVDYWDSRGAPLPWCVALGGEAFYNEVIKQAEIYEETD